MSHAEMRPGSDGEHVLQQRLGTEERADRFYEQQVLDHLNPRMREFVLAQEMFFLATADRHGECDNSFRAGPPGFLRVLDERTLLFPEYRGNGVHASLGNLQENPHVGILLMDFLRARIGLHVNGRAEVHEDAAVRAEHPDLPVDPVPGRRAQLWVRVRVEEAYIHCAKHIPHLQKVPKDAARHWGTDDHKRKGGDFFGSARQARDREPRAWLPRAQEVPRSGPVAAAGASEPEVAAPGGAADTLSLPRQPHGPRHDAAAAPQEVHVHAPQAAAEPVQPAPVGDASPQPGAGQPGNGAADGAAAVIAARGAVPEGENPQAWRREAERALADAQQRATGRESAAFQGWFG
ncbi:pyridoxamine 5'-phosphate oxidase family protein [Streptomyces sp. TR02-1]|uniref:pyridoxamine 5'-phosphate oxidase family protein n=1 Tax=Streptomyces sp. TR02-1 TaxID=3385977 RepID=UPI0039A069C7